MNVVSTSVYHGSNNVLFLRVLIILPFIIIVLTGFDDMCTCALTNQTRCGCTEVLLNAGDAISVSVYNPLSSIRTEIVQVPVPVGDIYVTDAETGTTVRAQLIPTSDATKAIPAETR